MLGRRNEPAEAVTVRSKKRRVTQCSETLAFIRHNVVRDIDAAVLLMVGSYAEGNANAASDIDLIAITRNPRRRSRIVKAFEVKGRSVVIKYIGADQLRRKIDGLDLLYRKGRQAVDSIATRIADAALVYDTNGIGRSLIAHARRYRPSPITLRESARVAMTFYQDALGSIDSQDPDTAIVMARQAATFAVDGFLLRRGFRSLKPKWHLRRLRQIDAASVTARYRRVLGFDESTNRMHAVYAFAELDRLICEILEIDNVQDFERSPVWSVRPKCSTMRKQDANNMRALVQAGANKKE